MKKLMNKKAFTLMEMLIVVAIIAVLVAIAIPTFTNSLDKAKEATDVANIRAAYAEEMVKVVSNDNGEGEAYTGQKADAFVTEVKKDLNFPDKLTSAASSKEITYTATKLTHTVNGEESKVYTWDLAEAANAAVAGQ